MPEAPDVPALCREIRHVRQNVAGISQEEAARRVGVSLKAYRAYETFREPKLRRLRQLEAAFRLEEDYFLRKAGHLLGGDDLSDELARRHEELVARLGSIEEAVRELTLELRQPRAEGAA